MALNLNVLTLTNQQSVQVSYEYNQRAALLWFFTSSWHFQIQLTFSRRKLPLIFAPQCAILTSDSGNFKRLILFTQTLSTDKAGITLVGPSHPTARTPVWWFLGSLEADTARYKQMAGLWAPDSLCCFGTRCSQVQRTGKHRSRDRLKAGNWRTATKL